MSEVRYLRVQIDCTNGVVVSLLSEKSISMWAGYETTKRIIHFKDDGSEEVLDLAKIKQAVPPVLENASSAEPLLHVPKYQQERF